MNTLKDVREFCRDNKICHATFYNLLKSGKGPAIMKVGRRTLISPEAEQQWRRKMEGSETRVAA